MRKLIFVCYSILMLISCQQEAKETSETETVDTNSSSTTNDEAIVNELAAFYTGSMPCSDCDGIETMLTLNADEKRTFALEEQYMGKENRTVESAGTWTVADGVVTLNQESGSSKYEITGEGLVSLNADGSKRDAASAQDYLLKKVLGE